MTRRVRSSRAAVFELGGDVLLVGRNGVVRRLQDGNAELAREVIAYHAVPRTRDEVLAHVEDLAGELGERRAVVEQLIDLLVETGALAEPPAEVGTASKNIVVGVTGGLAATHAPALVAALLARGHTVEIALTPTAQRFVARDALAAIARREPHTSLWPRTPHAPVPHVALAEWADLVVIYPASATTLARLARGDFSELVSALALATRAPVVIAPAMNAAMLAAPAVERNLAQLRDDGFVLVGGVPAAEAAEMPSARDAHHPGAPSPAELAAAIDALLAAGVLASPRRARDWDAAYRRPLVPWASDACDPDLAAALAEHAPARARVLDVGCGLGQVARHAAAAGHRVVATDLSDVALAAARARSGDHDIVYVRDDICATALAGPFDVVIDRATLHALPAERAHAWGATLCRLAAPRATAIIKCHAAGIPGATHAYTATAIAALLPGFTVVSDADAELPGIADATPLPARIIVLRR